jgi:exopolysaccharide transport family protein
MLHSGTDGKYIGPPAQDWRQAVDEFSSDRMASGSAGPDLRELFRTLLRRRKFVIGVPIALVLAAIAFLAIVTPRYTATSTVLVDPRRANVIETAPPVLSSFGTDEATIESQARLIQSVSVLERVVKKLNLVDDPDLSPQPGFLGKIRGLFSFYAAKRDSNSDDSQRAGAVEALRKHLKVARQGSTFLIDINVSLDDPDKAAKIANAIADAYFSEQVQSKVDATKIAADWLNKQIGQLKSRVVASEKAVEDFRAANNLMASQGITVNDQQITDLNTKLIEARVQTAEARAKYDQVQHLVDHGGDPGAVAEALSSEVIARLRTQYADIVKNEADVTAKYGSRHPLVANLRAQRKDTQRLINEEVQRILESTRQAYQVAKSREASLQASMDQLKGVSTETGQAQVHLNELQREADANRLVYDTFLARYKQATAQESLELPESRIVAKASVPLHPSFPRPLLTIALAAFVGVGIGCVLAFLIDHLDRRVTTLKEIAEISSAPALAAIPLVGTRELARRIRRGREELEYYDPRTADLLPPALQPPLMRYAIEEPASIFANAVRSIRLPVQRIAKTKPSQVVMVTSAVDGEGKTTLAANLALSLATVGLRTILVEGDLRNPQLSRSFCPRATAGLFELAAGRDVLDQIVLREPTTGLSILPFATGSSTPEIAEILTELPFLDAIGAVLDDMRENYDVIIIDSPPLTAVADGRAFAEYSDGIILTVAWNRTPREMLTQAVEILAPVSDRILGTVLTQVDLQQLRYYDYYRSERYFNPYSRLGSSGLMGG